MLVQRLYFIRKDYPETLNILFCLRNTEPNRQNVIKKIPQGNQSQLAKTIKLLLLDVLS